MIDAISAGAGVVCLIAAGLLWIVGGRMLPRLTVLLVLAGTAAITGTWFGQRVGGVVAWIDQTVGRLTGTLFDARVAGLIAAVAAFVIIVHLWRRTVTVWTLVAAAVLPFAARHLTGDLGEGMRATLSAVSSAVGWIVGAPLGLT